jgi:hypothetical protein
MDELVEFKLALEAAIDARSSGSTYEIEESAFNALAIADRIISG